MPGPALQTAGFVLLKRPPSDAFQALTVFSPEHGNLLVLQRLARKSASRGAGLDLFDEAALHLETSNQGRTWFLKEARVLVRPSGIGESYNRLRSASAFASLIARNGVPEESREQVGALLRQVLAALTATDRPDVVYFKALYCFARDEGYPVKQQWLPSLPARDRTIVTSVLNQPLTAQTTPVATVARLQGRFEEYLRGHTEILLDDLG